ncbi:Odorant receptor 10a [Eumeta japonica]|uniref:Odorant receptor n=1 Tax=Eumeta variegata TaxID=151549 RepID=A0A4C1TKM9_EUMVA|nr:Odorant receptor 10a [Eumeta japonica]
MVVLNFGCFFYLGILSQVAYLVRVFPDVGETFKALDCLSATCIPLTIYIFLWRECTNGKLGKIFELSREGLVALPSDDKKVLLRAALRKGKYVTWLIIANMATVHLAYILIPLIFTLYGVRTIPTTPGGPVGFGITPNKSAARRPSADTRSKSLVRNKPRSQVARTHLRTAFCESSARKYLNNAELEQGHKDERVEETLKFCIKHHQFLIKYHKVVRKMYKGIFGQHYLIMAMVLVTTLQTIKVWDIRNTLLTGVTGSMPLIIYCFGGELVISAGDDLTRALQFCGWENMKPRHRKYVLFMLAVSQKPLQLTAADMFPMNRKTFGDMVQRTDHVTYTSVVFTTLRSPTADGSRSGPPDSGTLYGTARNRC